MDGTFLLQSLAGVRRSEGMPTATYCVVLDCNGETHCAVGDMDVLETISPEWVSLFVVYKGQPSSTGKITYRGKFHCNRDVRLM